MLSDTCSFLRLENRFGFQISTHKINKQTNKATKSKTWTLTIVDKKQGGGGGN